MIYFRPQEKIFKDCYDNNNNEYISKLKAKIVTEDLLQKWGNL